jgi:fatty acid desaturase
VATALSLPASNWLQHAGCTYESAATSANMNLGFFSRRVGFNIGYHSIHHARPAAHWTKLPEIHCKVLAASVPPARIRGGLMVHALHAGRLANAARVGLGQAATTARTPA